MMEWVVTLVGYLFIATALVGVLGVTIIGIASACTKLIHINDQKSRRIAIMDLAHKLRGDAWWFSEDKATMELLNDISDELLGGYSAINTDYVRDRWRRIRNIPDAKKCEAAENIKKIADSVSEATTTEAGQLPVSEVPIGCEACCSPAVVVTLSGDGSRRAACAEHFNWGARVSDSVNPDVSKFNEKPN